MRFKVLRTQGGPLLLGVVGILTLTLAVRGKLIYYIHPRYVVFTILLAIIAVIISFTTLIYRQSAPRSSLSVWQIITGVVVCLYLGVVISMPPATLSYKLAVQRGAQEQGGVSASGSAPLRVSRNTEKYRLEDWVSVLSQSVDGRQFEGKKAIVSGFIVPHPENENAFFVSRFVMTCCAVDARPLSIEVNSDNWRDRFVANQWVEVQGSVEARQEALYGAHIKASGVNAIETPEDPYAY